MKDRRINREDPEITDRDKQVEGHTVSRVGTGGFSIQQSKAREEVGDRAGSQPELGGQIQCGRELLL